MHVNGSVALVTGANRGLGRAIAEELLARGAKKVYAAVRNPESITDPRLVPLQLDVTQPDQAAEAARQATDVEIVVNNAGIGTGGTALSTPYEAAKAEIETNYLGLVAVTQAFAPVLAANGGGAFVNILSVVSWMGAPTLATYSASKSAQWGYTNAARIALVPQKTQVVGVHVGFIDTDLTASLNTEKLAPATVAASALDALEAGSSEALVDERTRQVKAALPNDLEVIYPALEQQFLTAIGAAPAE